ENYGLRLRPMVRPMYRRSYPVDQLYPFPRNHKVLEFITFSEDGTQSRIEHIDRFTIQCGDVNFLLDCLEFFNWYNLQLVCIFAIKFSPRMVIVRRNVLYLNFIRPYLK
ncbi:hypothetical protein CFOL_v3_14334, partial [Cephalotus follicularis]